MTKEEFQTLQLQQKESGKGLLQFLQLHSIKYTTYRYWAKKFEEAEEESRKQLAPIRFSHEATLPEQTKSRHDNAMPEGITLALPNGIQAHFSAGMEDTAIKFLTQSLQAHVLSE